MKRLMVIAVLTLFLGTGSLAFANNKYSGSTSGSHTTSHPRDKVVATQLRDQKAQINRDVAAGKLTKDQAKEFETALKSIASQLNADMRQNRGADLTVEQEQQLNQLLEANSSKIAGENK